MSNNLFKGVIKLTQEQFDTLRNTGTLTVGEETINYSPNDTMYVVEDNISEQVVANTNDITQLKTDVSDLETDMTEKLDKNQGVENAGKYLGIDESGNIIPSELSQNEFVKLNGTETEPIDIMTDIEFGKLYLCTGYIHLSKQSTSATNLNNSSALIYKQNDPPAGGISLIKIFDYIFNDSSSGGSLLAYVGTSTTIRIFNNAIYDYLYSVSPKTINGFTNTSADIYVPTTSGTSGQILQSNGNAEPTWITPNYVAAIDGKQLSTNDYTDEEKTKLQGIETGAEVNTIEQINVNGTNAQITNKTVNLNITDSSLIGNKINVSLNTSTYVMTISLLNSSDDILSTADIDFPLESVIVDGSYSNGTLTLELQNGTTIPIDISSIVNGLVPTSRTINGKSLTNNITLTAEDVDALPSTTNIPSSTSDLTNDSNFVSDSYYVHTDNNYTITEKNKLAGIEAGAQVNPTSLSELAEDSTHRLVTDIEKATWNAKSEFSGSYNDLTDKPTIPSDNTQLTNGAGYVTQTEVNTSVATKTAVNVNGALQQTLNFESDPQTQLDNKVNKEGAEFVDDVLFTSSSNNNKILLQLNSLSSIGIPRISFSKDNHSYFLGIRQNNQNINCLYVNTAFWSDFIYAQSLRNAVDGRDLTKLHADYDTGWFNFSAATTYTFTHNLGTTEFYTLIDMRYNGSGPLYTQNTMINSDGQSNSYAGGINETYRTTTQIWLRGAKNYAMQFSSAANTEGYYTDRSLNNNCQARVRLFKIV